MFIRYHEGGSCLFAINPTDISSCTVSTAKNRPNQCSLVWVAFTKNSSPAVLGEDRATKSKCHRFGWKQWDLLMVLVFSWDVLTKRRTVRPSPALFLTLLRNSRLLQNSLVVSAPSALAWIPEGQIISKLLEIRREEVTDTRSSASQTARRSVTAKYLFTVAVRH